MRKARLPHRYHGMFDKQWGVRKEEWGIEGDVQKGGRRNEKKRKEGEEKKEGEKRGREGKEGGQKKGGTGAVFLLLAVNSKTS